MNNQFNSGNPLFNILILEDVLSDKELMLSKLCVADFQCEVYTISDEAGLREVLSRKNYESIVSDLRLSGFDAFRALEICKELCPDIPFICVSDYADENTAMQLLQRGAVDYVFKEHLSRLSIAVRRALREAKLKKSLHSRTEFMLRLLRASELLNESVDKTTLLQNIADTAVQLTSMESSAIYMIEQGYLHITATHPELPPLFPDEFRIAKLEQHWHINQTVQTKEMVILQDALKEELSEQEEIILKSRNFRTLIYLPLINENTVLGVIILGTIEQLYLFTEEELEFFKTYANLSSAALQNAILFDKNKQVINKLNLLNRAVESSSVSVVITDAEGTISFVNPYFTAVTGYSGDEVLGKNPRVLQSGNQPKSFYEELWKTLLSGNDWTGEFQNKKKNGDLYWGKAIISPILNSKGIITNFVAIKEDITERKKMLEELVVAKEKAVESDQLKTAFINNISHEIRTPLNGILGFTQLITEFDLPKEERQEILRLLEQSSDRLVNTISDYMDMAKLVSNSLKVNKKELALEMLFDGITQKARKLCAEKKITFQSEIPVEGAAITLNTDPAFIQKIFEKLLDNAVKFTSQGSITIGCKVATNHIAFYVKDTGIGIENEKLELIFKEFSQADNSMARNYEGSGLGLTIAKTMVTLLGGEIYVASERGKGSEFTFIIPMDVTENLIPSANIARPQTAVPKKQLILIAEDDYTNYEFLAIVVNSLGHNYIHATNGSEAVALCKQNPEISLVLMDIRMPVMNGVEATEQIRIFRPELPIVAITAHAMTGDETLILNAGCNDYLSKPILRKNLMNVIAKYID